MEVGDALRAHCVEKAERLVRYFDGVNRIEVILDSQVGHEKDKRAEMIVHVNGTQPFVGSEEHADAFAAVDVLVDKLEEQLRRHKDRLRNRKHPNHGTHDTKEGG
jgi:putative sigma-54 modulation protein